MKVNVVGCGLSGITAAIILKSQGHAVEVFETRSHIGGNCYDEKKDGITVHKYGSHIFHTNHRDVWDFVNRYSSFNNYVHKVRANTKLGLISIPYNKKTIKQIGKDLSPVEIQDLIFREYSERHWGIPWESLPKSISGRIPQKRDSYDDRYFAQSYQGIPTNGYSDMFSNMLEGIKVHLATSKNEYKNFKCDKIIYTGKPDEFFDCCHGKLPYRSLKFKHFKGARNSKFTYERGAVINECNNKPYNRTSDNGVFLNETQLKHTIYTRDYPEEHDHTNDPIYPKNFGRGKHIYSLYKKAIQSEKNVIFLGRLATYKYLDMWMAIKQALIKLQ